jgi:3-hydroxyacyl-CoA dehydrogenase/enoyl-CoA hydratase/3-hydroxybutyryl-CoA epimerase
MPEPAVYVMEKMAHGFRRMGRDAGAGFYEYEDDGSASLWSGLKAFERRATKLPAEDISDRLLFIPALEAVRCVDDGIVGSLADADAALVHLALFPADTGGASAFINRMGTRAFVERAQALAASYGERFQPPARLIELSSRDAPLAEQPAPDSGKTAR